MSLYADAATSAADWRQRLQSAAADRPATPALRHKSRGAWVTWTWRQVTEETDRLSAALTQAGVGAGDRIALVGEISPSLLLTALAAKTIGAIPVAVPLTTTANEAAAILSAPVALAVIQRRDHLAVWLDARARTGVAAAIVFDHATAGHEKAHSATHVLSFTQFRALGEPSGWAGAPGRLARPSFAATRAWVEESTDWPEVFDVLTEAWFSRSIELVLPELLAAAARDRGAVQPDHWIVSPRRLDQAAAAISGRLPSAGLAGRLVGRALTPGRPTGIIGRLLRRRLGLSGLRGIDLATGPQAGGVSQAMALFAALGAPARIASASDHTVGLNAEAGFALPEAAQ